MTRRDDETLREARQAHRPAMNRSELASWMLGWSVGLGALWYFGLGLVSCTLNHTGVVGSLALGFVAAVQLLLPGVGLRHPGGARGPVILRSALTMSALWTALWIVLLTQFVHRPAEGLATVAWAAGILAIVGAPLGGVGFGYLALVGRGRWRSALLSVGAGVLALFALVGPALDAWTGPEVAEAQRASDQAWLVTAVLFALAALTALARTRARRDALDPARWIEGRIAAQGLLLGDEVRPVPEVLRGYHGPVCAYGPRVLPSAPGRGASPIAADALLPCTRDQLPLLLTDTRDAASSLALFLATCGAVATVAKITLR